MPVLTTTILMGAALAIAAGTAAKGAIDAKKAAKVQKKDAKKQERLARDALAAKPSRKTGANVEVLTSDVQRKRGKGSLAQRNRSASLGILGGESASAVGGL